jgi:hypothetical protein
MNISSDGSSCSWKNTRATGCPEKVLYLGEKEDEKTRRNET